VFDNLSINYNDRNNRLGAFRKAYRIRKPFYERALKKIQQTLSEIKYQQSRESKIRISYLDGRIKCDYSIIKKACDKNIPVEKVFDDLRDIIGIRIVVNNLKDIAPLIKEIKSHSDFEILEEEEHDGETPYRAHHLTVSYKFKDKNEEKTLNCEIQIRTLLQDAWAIISHHDVYKNQAVLPPLAEVTYEHLSDALSVLDQLANKFRNEIEKEVVPPNDLSEDAPLDKMGIAFLYYEFLGEKPDEYEVDYLIKKANVFGVNTVGDLRKSLSKKTTNQLKKIHDKYFSQTSIGRDLLEYGMMYATQGNIAFREYKKKIESKWKEIQDLYHLQILLELPETFDEFVEDLENGDVSWEAIKELGGLDHCLRCGKEIFDPNSAYEGVLDYYGFPDTDIDLESLFYDVRGNYVFEYASIDIPYLCSNCVIDPEKD
jgi:ppGpp synthetase/RelA/SpoT-type nucleotidyltranferase